MKYMELQNIRNRGGRSPCGERGLKYRLKAIANISDGSLPVRGAWVEIETISRSQIKNARRSPCGERGLKYQQV